MKRRTRRTLHEMWLTSLLRAYPLRFRARYGSDLVRLHRGDDGKRRWLRPLFDTLRDAPGAHWEERHRSTRVARSIRSRVRTREKSMNRLLERTVTDLRFTLRKLIRQPTTSLLTVATLSLGLGGLAAVGTVVHSVLLTPLPYYEPDRVVQLVGAEDGVAESGATVAFLDVMDYREQSHSFESIAAYDEWWPVLTGTDQPEQLTAATVNANYFDVLGVPFHLGRGFHPEEDIDGRDRVVVLQFGFWQRKFGGDRDVLGRKILLNGNPHEVVGVASARFEDPLLSGRSEPPPQLWRPLGWEGVTEDRLPNRGSESYVAIGRLASGVGLEAAQEELTAITLRLEELYPSSNQGRELLLIPITERVVGPVRSSLILLMVGMVCLLGIAVLNTACLALGRTLDRTRELAIRSSLGSGRLGLLRLPMAEGLLLGIVGGIFGLLLSLPLLDLLLESRGGQLPRAETVTMRPFVLVVLVAVALLVGTISSVLPAWSATRGALRSRLTSAASTGRHALRLRSYMVAGEVAMATVLLSTGLVLATSFYNLSREDTGMRTEGVVIFDLAPPRIDYPDRTDFDDFYDRVLGEIRALPGVLSAGAINILPLSGGFDGNGLLVPGQPSSDPDGEWSIQTRTVTTDALAAIGTGLLEGRRLGSPDHAQATKSVLINRATAERFWPEGDALGAQISVAETDVRVVGVVEDTKHLSVRDAAPFQAYFHRDQVVIPWHGRRMTVVVRSEITPQASLAPTLRAIVHRIDPQIPVANLTTLQQVIDRTMTGDRLRTTLLVTFAALGLALSIVGIYGVTAYAVATRRRELAIRLALGARGATMLTGVVRQATVPAALGLVLGLAVSWIAAGLLRSFLYGVEHGELAGLIVAPVLLLVVVLASLPSARRAATIDPVTALREE